MAREVRPYCLIDTWPTARLVTRVLGHDYGRVAITFPNRGTIEITANASGDFEVRTGPAPGEGGEFQRIANGSFRPEPEED